MTLLLYTQKYYQWNSSMDSYNTTVDLILLSTTTQMYSGSIVVSDLHVVLRLEQNDK